MAILVLVMVQITNLLKSRIKNCFSFLFMFLSLSLSLAFSLKKINKNIKKEKEMYLISARDKVTLFNPVWLLIYVLPGSCPGNLGAEDVGDCTVLSHSICQKESLGLSRWAKGRSVSPDEKRSYSDLVAIVSLSVSIPMR